MKTGKLKRLDGIEWEDLSYQLLSRYISFYGIENVLLWKFETWNEPDLKSYNLLNFTLSGNYSISTIESMQLIKFEFSRL